MNTKEWAELLNGREYLKEISREEEASARKDGVVIVFRYSDDCVEFSGAISDEVGACGGTEVPLTTARILENKCNGDGCPYSEKLIDGAITLQTIPRQYLSPSSTISNVSCGKGASKTQEYPSRSQIVFKLSEVMVKR